MMISVLCWTSLIALVVGDGSFSADFIGDFNHYSIVYKAHSAGAEEVHKLLQEEPDRVLSIKTTDTELYQCVLPVVQDKNPLKIEEYRGPKPGDLLQPLIDGKVVTPFGSNGYWFYEIAHGRYIVQYHDDRDTKLRTEYYLGNYRSDHTEEEAKKFNHLHPPKTKINNVDYPYYPVLYRHGTACDLTGKPRQTTILYICHEIYTNAVHSVNEVSTCNYEIVLLTNLLCSHPAFDIPVTPEHEIRCYADEKQVSPRPKRLHEIERQNLADIFEQFSLVSHSSTAPQKSAIFTQIIGGDPTKKAPGNKPTPPSIPGVVEEEDDLDGGVDMQEIKRVVEQVKKSGRSWSNRAFLKEVEKYATDEDMQLIDDFWSGKSCFIGGQGYWRFEICYNNKVSQFHIENNQRSREIIIGRFNANVHRKWFESNADAAFVVKEKVVWQVSNYYTEGDFCDELGAKRSVEVRYRCRPPAPKEVGLVLLSMDEPSPCRYVLVLESSLLCEGLQGTALDGIVYDTFEEEEEELPSAREIAKKIMEKFTLSDNQEAEDKDDQNAMDSDDHPFDKLIH